MYLWDYNVQTEFTLYAQISIWTYLLNMTMIMLQKRNIWQH